MHGPNFMQAFESIKYLFEKPHSMILTKVFFIADILLHVEPIAVLHDYKNTQFGLENIIAFDNISVITSFQHIDLSSN